jgi:hypothetical protein
MFKIVAVAGKLRGEEFILNNGENILGRSEELDFILPVDGISKNHFSITVTEDSAFLKDLDSSNGTFLNGKLIKNGTLKNGDKIALPDLILQVVFVTEKKIIVKKNIAGEKEAEVVSDFNRPPAAPKNLAPKLVWLMKYKLMPHLHGLNKEYEWKVMIGVALIIYVFISMYMTIYPALDFGHSILKAEVAQRGKLYAEEIARLNAKALERKALDQIDTSFIENNQEVYFELFDLEGRVVRPHSRLNEYIQDPFSVKARNWASKTMHKTGDTVVELLSSNEIGIAAKISTYNPRSGLSEAVGVIALRFKPNSIQGDFTTMLFLRSIIVAGLLGSIFFAILYFLTIRPLEEFKFQLDEAVRGNRRSLEPELKLEEANSLKSSINNLIQRFREADKESDDMDFDEVEDSLPYLNTLEEFLRGANGPSLILDQDKNLKRINLRCEDLTGIRESGSEGMSLLDVAREQGLAATIIELCDNSANSEGNSQNGNYELQGDDYSIFVNALMGKDGFAKGYYVTFMRDE